MKLNRIMAVILICTASPALADSYLSREVCQIEFESLKEHSGGMTTDLREDEKRTLLSEITESTGETCLVNYVYLKSRGNGARSRPYRDNCKGLPKKYFSDQRGRVIYRLSDRQMRQLEGKMLNDASLESCFSPLID